MRSFRLLALVACVTLLVPATAPAQARSGGPSEESRQILDELKAIRQLLETLVARQQPQPQPPAAGAPVRLTLLPTDHALGSPSAPVTLVEFTDLQCPFCRQFHVETFDRLKRDYVDTGKVRFVSRDLPLTSLHPLAMAAARVSRCAGEQGRFWEMRHAILVNNATLAAEMFVRLAEDLGLDVARLIACTNDAIRTDAMITADINAAHAAGMDGTPVFVLGRTEGDMLTGELIEGAQPHAVFDTRIRALLDTR